MRLFASEGMPLCDAQRFKEGMRAAQDGRKEMSFEEIWKHVKMRENYERTSDMSPDGKLSVIIEDDGDVIVTCRSGEELKEFQLGTVQFCTYAGGGKSPRVREALLRLAVAIRLDNEESPQAKRGGRRKPGRR